MNEIKKMLEKYYEGETTDADEMRLCEYFASNDVATELQPYRSIFAYIRHEKEHPSKEPEVIVLPAIKRRPAKWLYVAAAAVACLLTTTFLFREFSQPQVLCAETFVMIDGVRYYDLELVRKYAAEAIGMIATSYDSDNFIDVLEFINENVN